MHQKSDGKHCAGSVRILENHKCNHFTVILFSSQCTGKRGTIFIGILCTTLCEPPEQCGLRVGKWIFIFWNIRTRQLVCLLYISSLTNCRLVTGYICESKSYSGALCSAPNAGSRLKSNNTLVSFSENIQVHFSLFMVALHSLSSSLPRWINRKPSFGRPGRGENMRPHLSDWSKRTHIA